MEITLNTTDADLTLLAQYLGLTSDQMVTFFTGYLKTYTASMIVAANEAAGSTVSQYDTITRL